MKLLFTVKKNLIFFSQKKSRIIAYQERLYEEEKLTFEIYKTVLSKSVKFQE